MLYIWNLNFWSVWRYCQSKSCLPIYYTITNASLRSGSIPDLLSWVLKHLLLNKTNTMPTLFKTATCTNHSHTHSCIHTHHTYFYISKHAFPFNIKYHLVSCHLLLVSLLLGSFWYIVNLEWKVVPTLQLISFSVVVHYLCHELLFHIGLVHNWVEINLEIKRGYGESGSYSIPRFQAYWFCEHQQICLGPWFFLLINWGLLHVWSA